MPVREVTTDPDNLTLTLVADAAAPVERLWRVFTDPRQLERFWGPPGWPASFAEFDFTVGGRARYRMTSPDGEESHGAWEFVRIDDGTAFEVLDTFTDADGTVFEGFPHSRVVYSFEPGPSGSVLRSTTYFTSHDGLEQALEMGAAEGSRQAMEQLDGVLRELRELSRGEGTEVEILSDTQVRITRVLSAPRDLVWRAFHEPHLLRQWMLGPDGWSMTICEPGLEVGDSYRWAWEQDGKPETAFGFEGTVKLVDAPRRSVVTESMTGVEGVVTVNDMSLYEEDGLTQLTLLIDYPDKDTRDMILATGMTTGMEASYARLERVLAEA